MAKKKSGTHINANFRKRKCFSGGLDFQFFEGSISPDMLTTKIGQQVDRKDLQQKGWY